MRRLILFSISFLIVSFLAMATLPASGQPSPEPIKPRPSLASLYTHHEGEQCYILRAPVTMKTQKNGYPIMVFETDDDGRSYEVSVDNLIVEGLNGAKTCTKVYGSTQGTVQGMAERIILIVPIELLTKWETVVENSKKDFLKEQERLLPSGSFKKAEQRPSSLSKGGKKHPGYGFIRE